MHRATEWRHKNPEKAKAYSRAYYHKHREKKLKEHANWCEHNYPWTMWNMAKHRARREGLEFSIVVSDIVIPDVCAYLQIPLTTLRGRGRYWSNASLDRIDNTKGYTKDNIEVISNRANVMKNNATKQELVIFADAVLKRFKYGM